MDATQDNTQTQCFEKISKNYEQYQIAFVIQSKACINYSMELTVESTKSAHDLANTVIHHIVFIKATFQSDSSLLTIIIYFETKVMNYYSEKIHYPSIKATKAKSKH